jgi:preprotein translocase subunit SecG
MQTFLGLVLAFVSIFLILLVLVQRGRGGGLTGALGGMGGQSAFGAKAGDMFTYITIWTVVVWILLCVVTLQWVGCQTDDSLRQGLGGAAATGTDDPTTGGGTSTEPLFPGATGGEADTPATGAPAGEGTPGDAAPADTTPPVTPPEAPTEGPARAPADEPAPSDEDN